MNADPPADQHPGTDLDRTVAPGCSKIGYGLRPMTWEKGDPRPGTLRWKTVVVTGASSGLRTVAAAMARLGGSVHPVVRELQEAIRETETAHRPGPH